MPVSEFGEIGCALEHTTYVDAYDNQTKELVIEWRIRKTAVATKDNPYGEGASMWKRGDKVYFTSAGWRHFPDNLVFMPGPRERSLKPCVNRATDYARKQWPMSRIETH
jgi:hypothetical protein